MRVIQVCVGSSCHMKGSYYVIHTYKKLIEKYKLSNEVELKASFCMQKCMGGIAASINGEPIVNLTPQNCEDIFMERILKHNGNYTA